MLRGLAIQRVVMGLAAMILLSGAAGAAVWTSPSRAPGRTSAPTTATTVAAPPTQPPVTNTTIPVTNTTIPVTNTTVPVTSAPPTSAVTRPTETPTFLANTGSEPDMALWALLLVIVGGGLVWAEERSRLIALYRSPVPGRYRPRHSRSRS